MTFGELPIGATFVCFGRTWTKESAEQARRDDGRTACFTARSIVHSTTDPSARKPHTSPASG